MAHSNQSFEGRVVVVTGAARGIGHRCAYRFAKLGARVIGCDLNVDAESTVTPAGVELKSVDVRSEPAIQEFFASDSLADGIDVLVNCAGIQRFGDATTTSLEMWRQVIDINVTGAFLAARAAIPLMRRRGGGAIVNVSSIHAHSTSGGRVAYVTSKAALLGLTRALSIDHGGEGIRVNVVLPGAVETPMLTEGWATLRPDRSEGQMRSAVASTSPLGRIGSPDDIADAVIFLASPAASFITGAELVVDGGVLNKLALPVAPSST